MLPITNVTQLLLSAYGSPTIRPGLSQPGAPPTKDVVQVQFGVAQFENIDQIRKRWSVHGFFRTWWHDPRLAFDASAAGVDRLYLSLAERARVWQPSIYLEDVYSFSEPKAGDGLGDSFVVYADGTVWRSEQRFAVLSCGIDLARMPYDTQQCVWRLGIYTEVAHEVECVWKIGRDAFGSWGAQSACPSAWSVTAVRQTNELEEWPSGNYTYAQAVLDFTRSGRDTHFYLNRFYLPGLMLVALSYLGFFINPVATPARVALGVITILATLTNLISLATSCRPGAATRGSRLFSRSRSSSTLWASSSRSWSTLACRRTSTSSSTTRCGRPRSRPSRCASSTS